jgi:hypothetical protein
MAAGPVAQSKADVGCLLTMGRLAASTAFTETTSVWDKKPVHNRQIDVPGLKWCYYYPVEMLAFLSRAAA